MFTAYETEREDDLGAELLDAQEMAEWFSDFVFGFSQEFGKLSSTSEQRIGRIFGESNIAGGLSRLKDVLLAADERYQPGIALFTCGYPDDAINALSEVDIEAIEKYITHFTFPDEVNESMVVKLFTDSDSSEGDSVADDLDEQVGKAAEKDAYGLYIDDLRRQGKGLLSAEQEVEISKRIEAGLAAAAMLDGRMAKLRGVSRGELEWLANDGDKAKEEFIEKNLRLVVSIARKYQWKTTTTMQAADITSEGNTGLIHAIEKFDYTQGYKFSTYASWWIRQSITRGLADQSRTVRLPVHMVEKINSMYRTRRQLTLDLGCEPTDDELAQELNISVKDLFDIRDADRKQPVSLQTTLSDDGGELGDLIKGDDGREYLHELVQARISAQYVWDVVDSLDSRDADIIKRRFGYYGSVETLDDIGKRYGLTRERIRQLQTKAVAELRNKINYRSIEDKDKDKDVAPMRAIKKGPGRPSFKSNVLACIERGRNRLSDEDMEFLFNAYEAGTTIKAAIRLGIEKQSVADRIATIALSLEG